MPIKPKHAIRINYNDNYWIIFLKCLGWILLGAAAGYVFFYFFRDFSVSVVDRFRFLQGLFGIRHYEEGMQYARVILMIFAGNIISTAAYFALGYLRMLIPISILTGFLVTVLLFTGTVNNQQAAIPLEVILLMGTESFYRCIALSAGEHLQKNRQIIRKWVPITSIIFIVLLLAGAAFYEVFQIFGYIF
jgi:hypothetical protein